jgi:hypothetical protein
MQPSRRGDVDAGVEHTLQEREVVAGALTGHGCGRSVLTDLRSPAAGFGAAGDPLPPASTGEQERGVGRYGLAVASVNVSVLPYVPVRSGSFAPIACRNDSVSASLETGAV